MMAQQQIKAIETVYKGYRFRSRLEARWAVFFDALGIKWEYEAEGYDIGGVRYLPDFLLRDSLAFVEIKGVMPTSDEITKARLLASTNAEIILDRNGKYPSPPQGVYILVGGEFPPQQIFAFHHAFDHRKNGDYVETSWEAAFVKCPFCGMAGITANRPGWVDALCGCWDSIFHRIMHIEPGEERVLWGHAYEEFVAYMSRSPSIANAFDAARQARFEHGESGAR